MEHLYELSLFRSEKIQSQIIQLENSLAAFSQITDMPVSFYSDAGKYLWSTEPEKRICNANLQYGSEVSPCTRNLISSMHISLSLPEPYIFMCNSGMVNLCYALLIEEKSYGFLIAGPTPMGHDLAKTTQSFLKKASAEELDYECLIPMLQHLKLYTPKEMSALSLLFQNTITASLSQQQEGSTRRSQSQREQSEISQKLMQMKKAQLEIEYPYDSEQDLIDSIKAGDTAVCHKRFSKYVEDIMVFEGGDLPLTKLRIIGLMTQLTRSDSRWQQNYDNLYLLEKINEAQTLKEIVLSGRELVTALTDFSAKEAYSGSSPIIKKVVAYLRANYSQPITLKSTANVFHVNSSYLSTLFKSEMGEVFTSYLNKIRLARSEDLLRTTNKSVIEICMATGFSSASYFTKLFRAKNGVTPMEFRRIHC